MNLEEKVEKLYSNQYFEKIRTKKFITMLKVIVLDKEKNLDKIASKSGLSKVTVKKYLKGDELFSRFLTNYEYEEFLLYVKDIKDYEKSKLEEEKYFLAKNLINDILTTRYSIDEIYTRNYTTPYFADIILKDNKYLEENFGADIVNEIKFRIAVE